MKFSLLMTVEMPKMPIVVGILTFFNKKNNILGLSEQKKSFEKPSVFITSVGKNEWMDG